MSNQTVDVLELLKEKIHYELNFNWELEQKITDIVSMHFDKAITEQKALPDREADCLVDFETFYTEQVRTFCDAGAAEQLLDRDETGKFIQPHTLKSTELWIAAQAPLISEIERIKIVAREIAKQGDEALKNEWNLKQQLDSLKAKVSEHNICYSCPLHGAGEHHE